MELDDFNHYKINVFEGGKNKVFQAQKITYLFSQFGYNMEGGFVDELLPEKILHLHLIKGDPVGNHNLEQIAEHIPLLGGLLGYSL